MAKQVLRVIQYGTGLTGMQALRGALVHPQLRLVGLCVHDERKEGRSAGELADVVGRPECLSVKATRNLNSLITTPADCVLFMPADPTLSDPTEAGSHGAQLFDWICRILESGKNVVSTALVPLVYPRALGARLSGRLETACQAGRSSFFCTGISPGFIGDVLMLTLTGLSQKIRSMRCTQILDFEKYASRSTFTAYGFGSVPNDGTQPSNSYGTGAKRYANAWGSAINLIFDALSCPIDDIELGTEIALNHTFWEGPHGSVEPGTIGAHRWQLAGVSSGRRLVVLERIVRVHRDVAPEWPQIPNDRTWGTRIEIDGEPIIENDLYLGGIERNGTMDACMATAQRAVNSVPLVCRANPGVQSFLTLPPVLGAYALQ